MKILSILAINLTIFIRVASSGELQPHDHDKAVLSPTEINILLDRAYSISYMHINIVPDTVKILAELALQNARQQFGEQDTLVASALHLLGMYNRYIGCYVTAESLFNESLAIRKYLLPPDHIAFASSLNGQARLKVYMGELNEAEILFKRAYDIADNLHEAGLLEKCYSLFYLGDLLISTGKHDQAEKVFKNGLNLVEQYLGPDHYYYANFILGLGFSIYQHDDRSIEAEAHLKHALDLFEKYNRPDIAFPLIILGDEYVKQKRYAEGEILLKKGLEAITKISPPDVFIEFEIQWCLGNLYFDQGMYSKAEAYFQQHMQLVEKSFGSDNYRMINAANNLAKLYGCMGNVENSLAYYKKRQKICQNFMNYAFPGVSEDRKLSYINMYPLMSHSYLSLALAYISNESIKSTFDMILKSKAVVLDAVSVEQEIAYCTYDDKVASLLENLNILRAGIAKMVLVGPRGLGLDLYSDSMITLYNNHDYLENEISKNCSEFQEYLAIKNFHIADVIDALPDSAILWEFVRYTPYDFDEIGNDNEKFGIPRYLAYTLNHTGIITLSDLGEAALIDSLIRECHRKMTMAPQRIFHNEEKKSEIELTSITSRLYDIIFSPLEKLSANNKRIFISPDGQLNLLPFEILACPDGMYVIDKYRISYLSTGRDLLKFKEKHNNSNWAMVIANPDFDLSFDRIDAHKDEKSECPTYLAYVYEPSRGANDCLNQIFNPLNHTEEEAKRVAELLNNKANLVVKSFFKDKALEEVLKGIKSPPRVLHLSTHGFFCEDEGEIKKNPLLRSGIVLSGANNIIDNPGQGIGQREDGILTALEVSGLNLVGTELVTLSACKTGMGEVENGEGIYGLRRAFQHAGARSIIMSLWSVPDKQTKEIMCEFYNDWLSGETKVEALRNSALRILTEQRKTAGTTHPLYWGGFVLLGDPD